MKLKYEYKVDTWVKNDECDVQSTASQTIDNCDVEFNFDTNNALFRIFILIPNVKVMLNEAGNVDAFLDEQSRAKAYSLANYISNVVYLQTGKCDISEVRVVGYVPETDADKKELERTCVHQKTFGIDVVIVGRPKLSNEALSRYLAEKDALAIYVDAERMTNLPSKYREFFRVLEYYFPYEGQRFDCELHTYLKRFDQKYCIDYIRKLRGLRNKCSHAKKRNNYITSNDLREIQTLRAEIGGIQFIAKLLLDNPPDNC